MFDFFFFLLFGFLHYWWITSLKPKKKSILCYFIKFGYYLCAFAYKLQYLFNVIHLTLWCAYNIYDFIYLIMFIQCYFRIFFSHFLSIYKYCYFLAYECVECCCGFQLKWVFIFIFLIDGTAAEKIDNIHIHDSIDVSNTSLPTEFIQKCCLTFSYVSNYTF